MFKCFKNKKQKENIKIKWKNKFKVWCKIIFPEKCLICGKICEGSFCLEDAGKLNFIQAPFCQVCCQPLQVKITNQTICAKCNKKLPKYFRNISVLKYDEISKILIGKLKYFDQTYLAKDLAILMFDKAREIMPDVDFIAPVPLAKLRIIKRKYNQSALLAKNIAKISQKTAIIDLLIRTKNNQPQTTLSQQMRRKNVVGIFKVKKCHFAAIKDKNILIIDDVITTGATVEACCAALKKGLVNKIYVLTIAKTPL